MVTAQLVRVQPLPVRSALLKLLRLSFTVQLVKTQPLPVMIASPLLLCTRQDSIVASSPVVIAAAVLAKTPRSRTLHAKAAVVRLVANPRMEPLRTTARVLVAGMEIAIPPVPLPRESSKPFRSKVTPATLISIPLVLVTARLAD